jgi:hypothetical protein
MKEGLLRGDVRARWTLAHEIAHLVLQHPRRLQRTRGANRARQADLLFEEEANRFVSGLLAPFDRAVRCKTAEEIASAFRISLPAAQLRLRELKDEHTLGHVALKLGAPPHSWTIETGHRSDLEDQVAQICIAVLAMISEAGSTSHIPIEPLRNNLFSAAMLTASTSALLVDAYESVGRATAAPEYKSIAALTAAIVAVCPIREIGSTDVSREVLLLNQRCALKVAAKLLHARFEDVRRLVFDRSNHGCRHMFEFSYLKAFVHLGEKLIRNDSTVLSWECFPNYYTYNADYDICWTDIHDLEYLMHLFSLLDSTRQAQ